MKTYAIVQAFVIASIVAWSAWYAARRLLPTASRRALASVAGWLERPNRATWMKRLGHSMQPVQASSGGCGTSGCSTCGACSPAAPVVDAQPLVFKARAKP
jgi:hypothetical protein